MAGAAEHPARSCTRRPQIDGAGIWQQIRRITLPSLRPVNQVLVLVLFLWTFNDFNVPYMLFGKSAPEAADLISIHIYQSLVRHLELRLRLGHVRAAAALPARGDGLLSAATTAEEAR